MNSAFEWADKSLVELGSELIYSVYDLMLRTGIIESKIMLPKKDNGDVSSMAYAVVNKEKERCLAEKGRCSLILFNNNLKLLRSLENGKFIESLIVDSTFFKMDNIEEKGMVVFMFGCVNESTKTMVYDKRKSIMILDMSHD